MKILAILLIKMKSFGRYGLFMYIYIYIFSGTEERATKRGKREREREGERCRKKEKIALEKTNVHCLLVVH